MSKSKYLNVRVKADNHSFDSKKEYYHYLRLKDDLAKGNISGFDVHTVFPLAIDGVLICKYESDFVVYNNNGERTVVDVKSSGYAAYKKTQAYAVYRIKKNLMKAIYGIDVVEV